MIEQKKNTVQKIYDLINWLALKLLRNIQYPESLFIKIRALLILWISTCTVMWLYVFYCFMAFGAHYPVPWGGLLFTIIHSLVPVVYYYSQSFTASGLVLSLSGLGFQTLFCVFTGGVYSPAAIWLTLHPVILGFFGSTQLIIFQVLLNLIIVISLYFIGNLGFLPPSILPNLFRDGMIISCYVGLDILVAIFTVTAIRINNERNKELNDSRELTENLLRILCHDINNPLSIIKVSSKYLAPDELTKNPHHAERIRRACDDIQLLTGSIGSWIAYRDGKVLLHETNIPVTDIIQHVRFSFEDKLKEKGLNLNIDLPNENYAILGDRTAVFYQLFNNIVSNAVKFSFENSSIDISFSEEGRFIVAQIKDEGTGIKENIIDKVFSPYDRTSSKGTKNELGTGFGLPIVAAVIERMNGKISIQNRATLNDGDKGTLVTIHLAKA
ncbi:MAG: sensor histidine kinase [Bacteriovorax sp.]